MCMTASQPSQGNAESVEADSSSVPAQKRAPAQLYSGGTEVLLSIVCLYWQAMS